VNQILSLPIGITVPEATRRVREALTPTDQVKFDQAIMKDQGSRAIYLKTVSKSLGITLLPVKVRAS
jgi:hypothetical protein